MAKSSQKFITDYADKLKIAPPVLADISRTDQIMENVFKTSKYFIMLLNFMNNFELDMYHDTLLGDASKCSLPNVTSVLKYTKYTQDHPSCQYESTDSIGGAGAVIIFNGLCKKDDEWYFAKWRQDLSGGAGLLDCENTSPELKEEYKLNNQVKAVAGRNYALNKTATKYDPHGCNLI